METGMVNEGEDATTPSSTPDDGSTSAFAAMFAGVWILLLMFSV